MTSKKKILILSCQGGGGHMSVARAIDESLVDYDVIIVDLIGTELTYIDTLHKVTGYTGQDIYNFLLQSNFKKLTNFFYTIGTYFIRLKKRSIGRAITHVIKKYSPDLVISVIPIINDFILRSCDELNLPCIIVPTDFDATTFLQNVPRTEPKKLKICISLNYPEICNTVKNTTLFENIWITGFPIRASFLEHKNKQQIKNMHNIPSDKKVILIIMGATGSTATLSYLKVLSSITIPTHIIVCIGRGLFLKTKIENIALPQHITISIIDQATDIADMMAISDLCITKPGSVTFAEILYMNIPMLIDQTSSTLLWERLNIILLKNYQLGDVITQLHDTPKLVTKYLENKSLYDQTKSALSNLHKESFTQNINNIVQKMIS